MKKEIFFKKSFHLQKWFIICSVQSLRGVQFLATSWTVACQASLSITNSQSLLKLMSVESVMPSNHLILCHPLLLPTSIPPNIRVFSKSQFFASGIQSIGVSASASLFPMDIQDWFPLGWTGWNSLQSKGLSRVFSNSSKASILWHSAFIKVQLSHLYMTTGKTIALTIWTFVSKVVSLLFNLLSRFIIACCSSHKSAEVSAMMSLPWPPICSSHPSYMMLFKPYINLLLFLLSISSPLQASH